MTEVEPGLANRQLRQARGKVLGGTSAINAMIYIRANAKNYDDWQAAGNAGWLLRLKSLLQTQRFRGKFADIDWDQLRFHHSQTSLDIQLTGIGPLVTDRLPANHRYPCQKI